MLSAVVLGVIMALVGVGLTLLADIRLRLEERLAIAMVVGAVAVSVVSFAGFELLGMGWGALGIGLAGAGLPSVLGWRRGRHRWQHEVRSARRRIGLPTRAPASLRPLAGLTLAAAAVSTRTLSLAYQVDARGISVGSLSG